MKYHLFIIYFVLANVTILSAQKRCATGELEALKHTINPALKQQKSAFEKELQLRINNERQAKKPIANEIITIPVVFHVLYQNEEEDENVDAARLTSQIDVLNEDFRRKNADAYDNWQQAADAKIRFSLANVDINGNYFNGITRTLTNIDVFEYRTDSMFLDAKGGKTIWPGYLNIYVCDLAADFGGPVGFSSLPGYEAYIDAVVLDYQATGRGVIFTFVLFNSEGRTATHEVGHWLNLQHLWGPPENVNDYDCFEQDDGVEDTPFSLAPYLGCEFGATSCNSEDMTENFMEYQFDGCLNLFTEGQVERMHASIDSAPSRSFLKNPCHQNATKQTIQYKINSETELVQAIDTVYAVNQVIETAAATYQAGEVVLLENGFEVDASSTFLAEIRACTGN